MTEREIIEQQIRNLENDLAASDYMVIKCSECQLLGESSPYDINALHTERQAIRDQINELQSKLEALED